MTDPGDPETFERDIWDEADTQRAWQKEQRVIDDYDREPDLGQLDED